MLSPGERRRLDRIERTFHAEDPQLADMLSAGGSPAAWRWLVRLTIGILAVAAWMFLFLGVFGLFVLTAGMAAGLLLVRRRWIRRRRHDE